MQEIFLEVMKNVSGTFVSGPTDIADRLPGHASFYLPGVQGDALVLRADLNGICISSGSACHRGIIEASPVMRAIGMGREQAMGSVRISAGRFNTIEECRSAAATLAELFGKVAQSRTVEPVSSL
jgi:cysteine desulfurase